MTGINLSESLLEKAREKASQNGLEIDFLKHDARNLPFDKQFDVAIMMCEGGFPLMETDEMNFEILKNVADSLKDKAKFIFITLNGLFPIFNSINEFHENPEVVESQEGNATYKSNSFDLMTYNTTTFTDDDGKEHKIACNERYYLPCEITWLLKSLGFKKIVSSSLVISPQIFLKNPYLHHQP